MKRRVVCCLLAMSVGLSLGLAAQRLQAQALPAATGPGNYSAVGGAVSVFQSDYGHRDIGGAVMFADVHPNWRWGAEGEVRYLRLHTDEKVTETNYLIGGRYVLKPYGLRPYAKLLIGTSKFTFPFHYAEGRFFTYAPGGGLEYALRDAVSVRIVDFEYQVWPSFVNYGELRPYGISAGISWRFNAADGAPHGLKH